MESRAWDAVVVERLLGPEKALGAHVEMRIRMDLFPHFHGTPVVWRVQAQGGAHGFVFEGLPPPGLPREWLTSSTRIASDTALLLGPEPLIEPRAVALYSSTRPGRQVWVVTDGLRPFRVQNTAQAVLP